MKPKEKAPDLKSSLSGVAAILADNLHKEAKAGRIDILGEDQRWADQFRALCAWYKIEKGIDEGEAEGEGIRGIAAKLRTSQPTTSRKRSDAVTDAAPTSDGPTTTSTLERIRKLTERPSERGNARGVAGDSVGGVTADAPVFIAARRGHPIGMGGERPDNAEDDSGGDV